MSKKAKRNWAIATILTYITCVFSLMEETESSEAMELIPALIMGIPTTAAFLAMGYGIYLFATRKKRKEEKLKKEKLEEEKRKRMILEEKQKERAKKAGKKPCPACGAPVGILTPKCEYCGTANPHYNQKI